jgi:hypothetical protein
LRHRREPDATACDASRRPAEAPLEKTDNAAMLELTGLDLEQVVREGEQPEACIVGSIA